MNPIIDVILEGGTYRGLQIPDEVTASTGDPAADFRCVLQALMAGGMQVAMPAAVEDFGEPWSHSSGGLYSREGPLCVVGVPGALAQRIVACVNACAGKHLGPAQAPDNDDSVECFDAVKRDPLPASDAVTDRVNAWLSHAMTRAKITPSPESDGYFATLPPFRRFLASALSESVALDALRRGVKEWAWAEIAAGRELPTWETRTPEITADMKSLVRLSNLRAALHCRAEQWGALRTNLPAGALERCLVEIDQVVTRHAMQIHGTANRAPRTENQKPKTSDVPGGTSEAP